MPTNSWILEKNSDAFYERQPMPNLPAPKKPAFQCPFCPRAYHDDKDLDRHVNVEHYAPRPFALVEGRELSASSIRRREIASSSIHFISASEAILRIDGGPWESVAIADLPKRIAMMRRQTIELSLRSRAKSGTATSETYRIEFRIVDATALRKVEAAFRDFINPGSLSIDSLRTFVDDQRCQGEGTDYARALGDFVKGVLRKEDPSSKSMTTPAHLYREDYVRAGEILREIDRPLARLVLQLIRFGLNEFSESDVDSGFAELDFAYQLLCDPRDEVTVAPMRSPGKFKVCPVDHDTSRLIDLAVRMGRQDRWSDLLSNECRDVATSSEMEAVDQQKALAIWAASAWRLQAFKEALEPLRVIAAVYPFHRWATPLLEKLL